MKLMSDSISQIATALVLAQASMTSAKKDSNNPFFKSKYADLNAVREAVMPAFNANGIVIIQPTVVVEGKKYVQTMLLHSSGEFISGLTEILSAKELSAQDQGSGISYARRYGLQSLANVASEDDDGNLASGKNVAPKIDKTGRIEMASELSQRGLIKTSQEYDSVVNTGKLETKKADDVVAPARRSFRTPNVNKEEAL